MPNGEDHDAVGRIEVGIRHLKEGQDAGFKRIFLLLDDHGERIDSLEGARDRKVGAKRLAKYALTILFTLVALSMTYWKLFG